MISLFFIPLYIYIGTRIIYNQFQLFGLRIIKNDANSFVHQELKFSNVYVHASSIIHNMCAKCMCVLDSYIYILGIFGTYACYV